MQRVRQAVVRSLAPTAVMAVLWMVLGWVRSAGVQMAILWPLYFLTGALNGMEGSTLGGIVGKTLLLVLLNSFMKGVVIQTRGQGGRRRNFWNQFKANASNALLTRIPQFFNMKKLWNAGSVTAVGIPLSLDGGEDLDWHFIPTVICPQGLRAVAPTVAGAGGDRTLVLGLTGAPPTASWRSPATPTAT